MFKSMRKFFHYLEEQLFKKEWIGSPDYEALRFTLIYIFVGLIWIIWSDDLLVILVQDIDLILRFQTLKGWFYVFMSGLLFSVILKRRIRMIRSLSDNILYQNTHDALTKLPNRSKSAENTNLISLIDEFVFVTTLKLRRKWHDLGDHSTILSINLSSKGLVDPGFMHTIERLCLEHYYIPNGIQIEITETALISNFDLAKSHLLRLKRLGFIIALDDFGAGYSSLSYLHLLPIDCMKIDRSFSINPGVNNNQDLILKSIINLAQKLHLKVVAEGIETNVQKDFFLEMECLLGQGYLFAYPEAENLATQRIEESIEKAKL